MPLLLKASQMATAYGQTYQTFAIIDHEGTFRLKTKSLIPMEDLRDEVVLALADLPPIEEEVVEVANQSKQQWRRPIRRPFPKPSP